MRTKPQNQPSKNITMLIKPFVRLEDLDEDSLRIAARVVAFLATLLIASHIASWLY